MDNEIFIALLNPAIALTLAAAFALLWFYRRHRFHLAMVAVAYAASALGFLLQHFVLSVGLPLSRLTSNLFFTIAVCALAGALIARYGRKPPWGQIAPLALAGLAAFSWFMFVEPDLTWRVFSINFAFGGICLVVAAELRTVREKGAVEWMIMALALLSAVNFLVRPVAAMSLYGAYHTYDDFHESVYWTTAVLSHAVFSLLIALSLFTDEALVMMNKLHSDSLTDALSGLLNRRGFEARASALITACERSRLPVTLIVADLDRFKVLNDRHGHAAGDRVIAEFASRLKMAVGTRAVAGRLGGEEFAVLLPMADLASARLLADAVRAVFSNAPIDGLPPEIRVTASFGVAARSGDESLAELTRRADEALYHVKRGGRDGVRVSYQHAPEMLPAVLRPA
ncbi:MAG TPA: GGDEF domain-containing protein [Rhizobiaceae bacterium]